jgi:hypothetical protein
MDDNLEKKGCIADQAPWNKGRLMGQKPPLKREEIWAIRIRLQIAKNIRDLALFNLAIHSKLRACDLVKLRVMDVAHGEHIVSGATRRARISGLGGACQGCRRHGCRRQAYMEVFTVSPDRHCSDLSQ